MPPSRLRSTVHATTAALAVAALLSACSGGAPSVAGEAGQPVYGGTLTYLEHQPPTCLYLPAAGFYPNGGVLNQLTDKLTWQNPKTLEIEPWIATKWEVEQGRHRVHLPPARRRDLQRRHPARRRGRRGQLRRVRPRRQRAASCPSAEFVNNYERSEVIDRRPVKFHFTKPSPGFLQGTSVIGAGLVSKKTISLPYEEQCQLKNVIGSGPFTVANQVVDKEIDLAARKDYNWAPASSKHQGRAYLDQIKIIVTPEDNVRVGRADLRPGGLRPLRPGLRRGDGQDAPATRIYAEPTRGVNNGLYLRPGNSILQRPRRPQGAAGRHRRQGGRRHPVHPQLPGRHLGAQPPRPGLRRPVQGARLRPGQGQRPARQGRLGARRRRHPRQGRRASSSSASSSRARSRCRSRPSNSIAQQWAKIGVKLEIRPADAGTQAVDIKNAEKTAIAHSMVGRADQDVIKSHFHSKNRDVILSKDPKLDRLLEEESAAGRQGRAQRQGRRDPALRD